jgi:hypothetical protein
MKLSELKGQGVADRACGSFAAPFSLDSTVLQNAVQGKPIGVDAMCAAIRFQKVERADIVKLLDAMAGSVVMYWPRSSKGFTTSEAADVLEWLDNASDNIADGVGLSDWVAK